jgi:hypothetical protein
MKKAAVRRFPHSSLEGLGLPLRTRAPWSRAPQLRERLVRGPFEVGLNLLKELCVVLPEITTTTPEFDIKVLPQTESAGKPVFWQFSKEKHL